MKDKIVGSVYESINYNKFKFKSGNRPKSIRKKLYKSIKEMGQLVNIIVDQNFNILEGQHRFVVLEKLGLPIRYVIRHVKSEEHAYKCIIEMNKENKNWVPDNYIHSYSDRKYKYYQALSHMRKESKLTANAIYQILRKRELSGEDKASFTEGNLVLTDDEKYRFEILIPKFQELHKIDKNVKKAFSRTKVISGAADAFLDPLFDFKKFVKAIKRNTASFYAEARDRATPESFKSLLYKKIGQDIV